jgi:hypothetical protein
MRSIHIVCTAILLAAVLVMAGTSAWSAERRQPLWQQIVVAPPTLVPQPMEGAPSRADEKTIKKSLSEAAMREAAKALVRTRLAAKVEAASATEPASAKGMTFSGTISLPVSLPPYVIGLRAHNRKGVFATAHFTLRDAEGKIIAEQQVSIRWDDVRWTRGSPRWRRNRLRDDVLEDAVRKVFARGVWQLSRQLENAGGAK